MKLLGSAIVVIGLSFTSAASAKDESFNVATKSSIVNWTGSKVIGDKHVGTLQVKSGQVTFKDGQPAKAEIIVDMTSLKNSDLTDPTWNTKLVTHLKSDDFFSIDKFSEAKLVVNTFKKTGNKYELQGDLSVKGKTKPVTMTAVEVDTKNGRKITADLTFDRTDFDVRYGSGKFFENLGDKMISDDIQLQAVIQLEPNAKTASN